MNVDSLNKCIFMVMKLIFALVKVHFLVMTSKTCKSLRNEMIPLQYMVMVATDIRFQNSLTFS